MKSSSTTYKTSYKPQIIPVGFFPAHLPTLQQMDAAQDGHHRHEAGQRQQQPGTVGRPVQWGLRQQWGEAAEEAEADVVTWGNPGKTLGKPYKN